jgi:hypothetical protein
LGRPPELPVAIQVVHFAGFDNCVEFLHQGLRLVVTTEVGPRILFFGFEDGPNMLLVKKEHEGLKDGLYHSYGGHRLWIAPESRQRTYTPDSFPVEVSEVGDSRTFKSIIDEFGIQKEITITPINDGFRLDHCIHNHGPETTELAPWAVTVMAPGGLCIVPQHPLVPQGDDTLLPVQPVVLWSYTDMTDPRFTWGKDFIKLRSTDDPNPTKFGTFVSQGVASYANFGCIFTKRFSGATGNYPDGGCNFESYTRPGMLEVESLAPLVTLSPGDASPTHSEDWILRRGEITVGD